MSRYKDPVTNAIRALRQAHIAFEGHPYSYVQNGGTAQSAAQLGVAEHQVIKTLIMEDDRNRPLIVLMHGDRQVSAKELARRIGAKSVRACTPATAQRHSGYQVGGTSPFGVRTPMPVYCERSIGEFEHIFINGGKRGYLIRLATADLLRLLKPILVDVGRD